MVSKWYSCRNEDPIEGLLDPDEVVDELISWLLLRAAACAASTPKAEHMLEPRGAHMTRLRRWTCVLIA